MYGELSVVAELTLTLLQTSRDKITRTANTVVLQEDLRVKQT